MGISVSSNRRGAMADINVTPLVDVMLVLLIIFMVAAPMMREGFSVNLPEAPGDVAQEQHGNEITVSVSGAGDIFVNEVSVKESDLADFILSEVKDKPAPEVYLRADKTVRHGIVVGIMAAVKSAGIKDIIFITQAEDSGRSK